MCPVLLIMSIDLLVCMNLLYLTLDNDSIMASHKACATFCLYSE